MQKNEKEYIQRLEKKVEAAEMLAQALYDREQMRLRIAALYEEYMNLDI